MAGQINQLSRLLGQQEATLASLTKTFEKHCDDDDRRHQENIMTLRAITSELHKINESLAPLAGTVAAMKPIVDGYQVDRWKLLGAISLASVILSLLGWVVMLVAGKAVAWFFSAASLSR